MRMSISTFGWATLVTHLDTIAGSLPTNSARHLFVISFSASTTLGGSNVYVPLITFMILLQRYTFSFKENGILVEM